MFSKFSLALNHSVAFEAAVRIDTQRSAAGKASDYPTLGGAVGGPHVEPEMAPATKTKGNTTLGV
jgi:hypothetical protein